MRFRGEVPGRAEKRDEAVLWRKRREVEGGRMVEGGAGAEVEARVSLPKGSGEEGNSISKPDISAKSR